jgi:uncharacterized protein
MKRNLLLAATSFTMLSANPSFAQTDADNFYRSNVVNCCFSCYKGMWLREYT